MQKKASLQQQKVTPKIINSYNINLYDFYLNMIHFIWIFYYKYLVVDFKLD